MKKLCLNVGCGNDYRKSNIKEKWVNLDIEDVLKADVKHNLNVRPYPFKKELFDKIIMYDVLEHLYHTTPTINEIWRICKYGGIFECRIPIYPDKKCFRSPEHYRYFTRETLMYYTLECKRMFRVYSKKFALVKKMLYRKGFPTYHIKKHLGIDLGMSFRIKPDKAFFVFKKVVYNEKDIWKN